MKWFRKMAFMLSRADTHTPVGYWYSLGLADLLGWVVAIQDVLAEEKKGR